MILIGVILLATFLLAVFMALPVLGGFGARANSTKRRNGAISIDKSEIQRRWHEISASADLGGAAHLKSAIMDADKLTEKVLASKGYHGTFAECLKAAKKEFREYKDYDNLWYAHKVRNSIAHDNGVDFSSNNAKKALGYFHKALTILGAL